MRIKWKLVWIGLMVGIMSAAAGCDGSGEGDSGDAGDTDQDLQDPVVTMDNVALYQGLFGTFGVEVTATDDVGISTVELLVGGEVAASSNADPFTISWDTTATADGIASIAVRATDTSGKTAETTPLDVVVVNDGYAIEFYEEEGFSGEIVIPDPYTGTEVDMRHHWDAPEAASRILSIVLFTVPAEQAEWEVNLDIGTGWCPDSGVTLDTMTVTPGDEPVVFDSEPAADYPGGGQMMFYHLRPLSPALHAGESIGYEIHAFAFYPAD